MYKSPGGPPLVPGSPLPVERMRMPSSMPAGIFTSSVFCFLSLPWPWQVVQGSGMILPVPRQCGHFGATVIVVIVVPLVVVFGKDCLLIRMMTEDVLVCKESLPKVSPPPEGFGMPPARPTLDLLRAMSDRLVITSLATDGPASRALLAGRTGLSKPTVGQSVSRLVDEGIVAGARPDALVIDSASASLEDITPLYQRAHDEGLLVALEINQALEQGQPAAHAQQAMQPAQLQRLYMQRSLHFFLILREFTRIRMIRKV